MSLSDTDVGLLRPQTLLTSISVSSVCMAPRINPQRFVLFLLFLSLSGCMLEP